MNTIHQQKCGILILAHGDFCDQSLAGEKSSIWVAETANQLVPERILIATTGELKSKPEYVEIIKIQKGKIFADAVVATKEYFSDCERIVVIDANMPLVTQKVLRGLIDSDTPVAVTYEDNETYSASGPFSFSAEWLYERVAQVKSLGELLAMYLEEGGIVASVIASSEELIHINDRYSFIEAESGLRKILIEQAIGRGVLFSDPKSVILEHDVDLGCDVRVEPNCQLYGQCIVQAGAIIGPGTILNNARVGEKSTVLQSVVSDSEIGSHVSVGPFSHIREGTFIGDYCEIGTSAEVKASTLENHVKMHHFSYLGDTTVGKNSNIGAGAITCNFDGQEKHKTKIGSQVFIGSSTMLVAPINIGDDAVTGAGSVVVNNVPAHTKVVGVPARNLDDRQSEQN
jgi:bifunctional N-acetylglucosamine-1-phosphate-uridyltransferase/glucosamine-1-phosphate-acetyltransferase GlmU-like protein